MPEVFSTKKESIEPAREATPLLIGKLLFALFLPILLYIGLRILSIEIPLPMSEAEVDLGFLVFLFVLTLFQAMLILSVVLSWKQHIYYFTEDHITEKRGLFTTTEKMYDLKSVRHITVRQGVFGKVFSFGTLIIESTAPNFSETITLIGIPHPEQYETFLKRFV